MLEKRLNHETPTISMSWEFNSDVDLGWESEKISTVESTIRRLCEEEGWNNEEITKILFGFNEIFANALVHGNLGVKQTQKNQLFYENLILKKQQSIAEGKKVFVKFQVNKKQIVIKIIDQGSKEINLDTISKLAQEDRGVLDRGRGVKMTQSNFDEFDVRSVKVDNKILGTEVTMKKFK